MSATPLAFRVSEILAKYCPKVIDVTFTRELETKMEQIELGKETPERVVLETVDYLKPIIEGLKLKEDEIGTELTSTIREMKLAEITLSVPCPKCGGNLMVIRSKQSGKRFIGCSGKWKTNCAFTLPLPQFGALTLLDKRCPECGFQMVQVRSKGRRPMISCSNCYVNKQKISKIGEVAVKQPISK